MAEKISRNSRKSNRDSRDDNLLEGGRDVLCDLVALPFEIVPSDVPLSVLEAMALALPVITTQVACLPELVPAGCGLRLPPGDDAALAAAIAALAADSQHRCSLGSAARARARTWQELHQDEKTWDHVTAVRSILA